jgi:hypothetical protein
VHPSRHPRLLALLAALGYAVEGAIVLRSPQGENHWHAAGYAVEIAFAAALVATIALVGRLRTPGSRAASIGAPAAMLGFGAMLVQGLASIAAGGDVIGPVFFLGLLTALAGLIVLATASVRRRGAAWWEAPVVLVALIAGITLGDHGGGLLIAAGWLLLAVRGGGSAHPLAPAVIGPDPVHVTEMV